MSLYLTDDMSTLVQVMAWCRQATSHCLSQCWPRSMLPYGVTRPQWVNISNFIHYKVLEDITLPFPNIDKGAFKVWKLISNFIPYFTGHVITYPCWDSSYSMLAKGPLVDEIHLFTLLYHHMPTNHHFIWSQAFPKRMPYLTWNINWNKFCRIGITLQCMNSNNSINIFLIAHKFHATCIIYTTVKPLI